MGGLLVWLTLKKLFCKSGNRDSAYCRWINELAVGLGLLGTIRGFILVASEQSVSINNGRDETLSAILIGMGSTLWELFWQSGSFTQTPEDPDEFTRTAKKGVMFAAMTDLFMNFALALVWVLFVMPVSGSLSPERSPDPIESKDGERPGSGVRFATVSEVGKVTMLPFFIWDNRHR